MRLRVRKHWRIGRLIAGAVGLFGLSALVAQGVGAVDETRFFRIGTAATTGTYFQVGGVLASAISKAPGSRDCEHGGGCGVAGLVAVAQATQGSIENLIAVGGGQLDSALSQSDVAQWAYQGDIPAPSLRCKLPPADLQSRAATGAALFKGKGPLSNLRQIAALFPEDIQIVVRADSDIKALKDLKGKRLSLGEPGSGTIVDARLVLDAAGVSECDVKSQYFRLSRAVEALQGNEIDGFVIVAGAPVPAIMELAAIVPIRLVPIDPAVLNKLMGRPPFYHADTIANGTYPGLDAETATVSVMALWIVNAAAPEPLIYAVTKALWQEQTRRLLDFASPVGKRIRIATALTEPGVPLHPGAARYYRERGMELPPLER